MDEEIQQVPAATPDFQTEIARQLAEMLPEIVADGKIDVAALQAVLGDDMSTGNERFGLFWPGKTQAIRAAQTPTTATLSPDHENSVDWENTQNVVIEGDNLEVLKILRTHYLGKIKMIYIDPPYNTGNDFVYEDDYADPIGSYLELTGQSDGEGKLSTNTESDGRFHSNWLSMMYPRLKIARELLRQDGILLCSIDESELSNLRQQLIEIFGEQNEIAIVAVKRPSEIATNFTLKRVEYILAFARTLRKLTFSPTAGKMTQSRGTVGNLNQTQPPITFPAGLRCVDIPDGVYASPKQLPDSKENIRSDGAIEVRDGMLAHPIELTARWRSSNDMRNFFANDCKPTKAKINGTITDIYLSGLRFMPQIVKQTVEKLPTLIQINPRGSDALNKLGLGDVFTFPKSPILIEQLLNLFTADRDIVLDFFAGSGTTAHAVMALNAEDGGNRRCISVQLPEPTGEKSEARKAGYATISEITRERIRRAGKKILEEEAAKLDGRAEALDVGFRAYKLVDTNFAKWRADSSLSEGELMDLFAGMDESADDDAWPEALLTEVLLKLGFSLTEQVQRVDVEGLDAFSVADGLLVAYLNEHVKPALEQLRALVGLEPERLVILEDAFQGDDELKTNLVQECRSRGVDLWTV